MKTRHLCIALLCLFSIALKSQEHVAPSLQIGLNSFQYNRGTLDQELILEIISEKQDEIKERLIRFMLLDRLDVSGATIYGYVDNTIDILKNVEDPELRTRSIIENSVNLAIIGSYMEYFIIKNRDSKELQAFYDAIDQEGAVFTPIDRFMIANIKTLDDIKFNADLDFEKNERKEYFELFEHPTRTSDTQKKEREKKAAELLLEVEQRTLDNLLNSSKVKDFDKHTKFTSIIMDMAATVIDENQELKRLGIYKNSYVNQYISQNRYLLHREDPWLTKAIVDLKGLMRTDLANIMSYTGLLAYLDQLNHVNIGSLKDLGKIFKKEAIDAQGLNDLVDEFSAHFSSALDEIGTGAITLEELNATASEVDQIARADFEHYQERVEIISAFLYDIQLLNLEDISDRKLLGDLLYRLSNEIIPAVNELTSYSPDAMELRKDISKLSKHILAKISYNLEDLSDDLFNQPMAIVLAKLYQLDKAETYEQYFTILTDVGKMFKNEAIYGVVQTITSFTNTYMKFVKDDEGQEAIQFDVEGILSALSQKSYNRHRWAQFHFTVGMSNMQFSQPYMNSTGEALNSVSFVSEKIGVKFLVYDWAYIKSFNRGETFRYYGKTYKRLKPKTEPIVDNFHVLLYGSGLLYNIGNLASDSNFEHPIFGGGLGLTFFNGLDVNFTVSAPVYLSQAQKDLNSGAVMYGLGFDIQFIEYAQRLNAKRKKQQMAKKVAKLKESEQQLELERLKIENELLKKR